MEGSGLLSGVAIRGGEAVKSWVVTVPKAVQWKDYQRELDVVVDGTAVLNFRVRGFPKALRVGDRCYIVNDGRVRGWMTIVGKVVAVECWQCVISGKWWGAGRYIQRSGKFHALDPEPEMIGFQGVRRYPPGEIGK